jgi:hypothetical protein
MSMSDKKHHVNYINPQNIPFTQGIGVPNKRICDPAEAVFKDLSLKSEQVTSVLDQFAKLLPSVRIFK